MGVGLGSMAGDVAGVPADGAGSLGVGAPIGWVGDVVGAGGIAAGSDGRASRRSPAIAVANVAVRWKPSR